MPSVARVASPSGPRADNRARLDTGDTLAAGDDGSARHADESRGFGPLDALDWLLGSRTGLRLSLDRHDLDDTIGRDRLLELAAELERVHAEYRQLPPEPVVDRDRSPAEQARLLATADALGAAAGELRSSVVEVSASLALRDDAAATVARRARIRALSECVDAGDVARLPPLSREALETELDRLERSVDGLHRARRQTGARYRDEVVMRMDIESLEAQWGRSARAIGPLKAVLRRRLRATLQALADSGLSDPRRDLRALRALRKYLDALARNPLTALAGPDRNTAQVRERVERALDFRTALRACRVDVADPAAFKLAAQTAVRGENPDLIQALADYRDRERRFSAALTAFIIAGGDPSERASLEEIGALVDTLGAERPRLVERARWYRLCQVAKRAGLAPIVQALESGDLEVGVVVATREAYARSWLPLALSARAANRDVDMRLANDGDSVAATVPRLTEPA